MFLNVMNVIKRVIPASPGRAGTGSARRESFLKKDSGQAGMTDKQSL